jgi:hypothetical protein
MPQLLHALELPLVGMELVLQLSLPNTRVIVRHLSFQFFASATGLSVIQYGDDCARFICADSA